MPPQSTVPTPSPAAADIGLPSLTDSQVAAFDRDGILIVDRIIAADRAAALAERFATLFAGRYETGLQPDEVNWKPGRDAPDRTRQLCNAWKSDRLVAGTVLAPQIGAAVAALGGWPGARISQDNLIWKPPGGHALGFHQDSSYEQWAEPSDWVSCWIALDDTTARGGTVSYVRGSHRWSHSPMIEQFHAPDDPYADLRRAATAEGLDLDDLEIVQVEVPRGGGVFHQGWTWHGSDRNRADVPRRSLVAHCMSSETRFHPEVTGALYSRYKRFGSTEMDESFFPVIWRDDGYRSPFLDDYLAGKVGWAGTTRVAV